MRTPRGAMFKDGIKGDQELAHGRGPYVLLRRRRGLSRRPATGRPVSAQLRLAEDRREAPVARTVHGLDANRADRFARVVDRERLPLTCGQYTRLAD